jgi:putative ABC transport system permease protein
VLAGVALKALLRFAPSDYPRMSDRLIVGQGLRLVLIGVTTGLLAAAAAAAAHALTGLLFETSPNHPLTFASGPVLLAIVALAASYFPARRVDPLIAMRAE